MSKSYKSVERVTTIGAAVEDAFSEMESLHSEMEEMEGNMSGSNMEHLPKYEVVSEAQDELSNHVEAPDVPEELSEISVTYHELVNKRKGRGPSRDVRLSNAQAMLRAVQDLCESEESEAGKFKAADELAKELDEHIDFDVMFPGMFG